MAQCANHPDRAAQQKCSRCGKGLCEQCVELWDQGKPFCYDCAVELQLSEMRERSREEKAAAEEAKEARRKVGSRSFIITTAVVAMLLLAAWASCSSAIFPSVPVAWKPLPSRNKPGAATSAFSPCRALGKPLPGTGRRRDTTRIPSRNFKGCTWSKTRCARRRGRPTFTRRRERVTA